MRRHILDSRLLHYTLLSVSLAAATAGGLVLLGCTYADVQDVTVDDASQRYENGGVLFHRSETRTSANVTLAETIEGQPVKWSTEQYSWGQIPDPNHSNRVVVNMPGENRSKVTFFGTYTVDGNIKNVKTTVNLHVEN